ncbi:MAG: hypothetical protein SCH71_10030 [Desulfobulbaceae bacterium]|nr:hypothetical protein [Desulfobulbaceae bacterium]
MIKKCCVCSRVKTEGKWHRQKVSPAGRRISHAYCPSCFAKTMVRIENHIPGRPVEAPVNELGNVLYGI